MTKNDNILTEAAALVDGARREAYGTPLANHTRTAAMWSAYLGVPITPRQVCMLNVLQKVSRDAHSAARDNLVDIAGYARNAELCGSEEKGASTLCGARSSLGWTCSREPGHRGSHVAYNRHDPADAILEEWPQ